MIPLSLRVRGLTVFKDVSIDFKSIPGDLVAITGHNGCLVGSTLVDIPRDLIKSPWGFPIKDLVGTSPLVYTYDETSQRFILHRACNVRKTAENVPVYRLRFTTIDSRFSAPGELTGTYDHPVMLHDGTYRFLGDLRYRDRLMPMYRRLRDGEYSAIYHPSGSLELEHRLILDIESDLVGHHLDGNRLNNTPKNLTRITPSEHSYLHNYDRPPTYMEHPRGMLGKRHSEATKLRIGEAVARLAQDPRIQDARKAGVSKFWSTQDRPWTDPDCLYDLYVRQRLSTVQIGERLGASDNCIGTWLRKHGIKARSLSESQIARANHLVAGKPELIGEEDVYDMEVPGTNNFVANGVVVHNSGKTTLMEAVFAGLYRFLPTRRENSYSYFHGRDAMIEFRFSWHGKEYRSVINVDAPYSTMESFLYDAEQKPIEGASGKNRKFDEVIARMFGDSGMVLASSFAAQDKSGNFFTMERSERKQLFIQMLNQEILTKISKASGARLGLVDSDLIVKRAAFSGLEAIANQPAPDLQMLIAQQENTIDRLSQQRQLLSELRERYAILKAKADLFPDASRRAAEIQVKVGAASSRISRLKKQLQDTLTILERSGEINSSVTQLVMIRSQIEERRRSVSQLAGERRLIMESKQEYDHAVGVMREEWLKQQGTLKTTEVQKSQAEIASATIQDVPCKAEGEFAKCKFLTRAVAEKENLDGYEVAILNCRQAMLKIQDDQNVLPKPNTIALTNLDKQISQLEESIQISERRIRYLEPIAAKVTEIGAAEGRRAELTNQIDADEHHLGGLLQDLEKEESAASGYSEIASQMGPLAIQISGADGVCRSLELQTRDDIVRITQAESALARIKEAKEKMEPISQEIYLLDRDRRQWALLEKAFGPAGIQSLEIDAAGPTVSAYANDLLFSCFGPRFSLKLITQKLMADGSGFKDEFDAYVIDTERGREGSIAALSGGERVILSEAISLAVAIFNKSRSGISWESLWRDECTGALDEENAPRYIKMLRRAREMGHFSKVYFVAHQEHVRSLADSRIAIEEGTAQILS